MGKKKGRNKINYYALNYPNHTHQLVAIQIEKCLSFLLSTLHGVLQQRTRFAIRPFRNLGRTSTPKNRIYRNCTTIHLDQFKSIFRVKQLLDQLVCKRNRFVNHRVWVNCQALLEIVRRLNNRGKNFHTNQISFCHLHDVSHPFCVNNMI